MRKRILELLKTIKANSDFKSEFWFIANETQLERGDFIVQPEWNLSTVHLWLDEDNKKRILRLNEILCTLTTLRLVAEIREGVVEETLTQATSHKLDSDVLDYVDAILLANSLMTNTTVRELYLDNNLLRDYGVACLAEALVKNSVITKLSLIDNRIGDAVRYLAGVLAENTSLKVFYLNGNSIDDGGVTRLAYGLSENTTLVELGLGQNHIRDDGVKKLAWVLKNNKKTALCKLDLGHNRDMGEKSAEYIADMLKYNAVLQELDLSGNRMGGVGLSYLAGGLKENNTLEKLGLRDNDIGGKLFCILSIIEILITNTSLKALDLRNNQINSADAKHLVKALEKNFSLQELFLDGNNIDPYTRSDIERLLKRNRDAFTARQQSAAEIVSPEKPTFAPAVAPAICAPA